MDDQITTTTQDSDAQQAPTTPKKPAKKAAPKAAAKKEKPGAWKKDPKRIAQLKKDIPLGSLVKYTGSRVDDHEGKSGVVIGYRDANGLYVDFGKLGKGSISVPKTQVLRKGEAKKAPQKEAASN